MAGAKLYVNALISFGLMRTSPMQSLRDLFVPFDNRTTFL